MADQDEGRLGSSLGYLNWRYLMAAVLAVYQENGERHDADEREYKQNADVWCTVSSLRQDIYQRTCKHWCRLTELDITSWPYNLDFVSKYYFRFRKRNKDEIEEFRREIGVLRPPKK